MDLIMENNFEISSNQVLNLKQANLSTKQREIALEKFKIHKWLVEKNGYFSLHTRAVLELEQYLLENYDMIECNHCKDNIFAIVKIF